MPSNRPSASAVSRLLTPNPPRPYLLSIQSILQPATIPTPTSVRVRFKGDDVNPRVKNHPVQEWKGSSSEDHAVNRTKRKDTTDPETENSAKGQAEREEYDGIAEKSKSQATTQRDLGQHNKRAKEEHPAAPEPVIGMNDEKGRVSCFFRCSEL